TRLPRFSLLARLTLAALAAGLCLCLLRLLPALIHLALEVLGALPEIRLFAGQLLQLALQLFFGHRLALLGQVGLPLQQLVLPPREIADLVQIALIAILVLLG